MDGRDIRIRTSEFVAKPQFFFSIFKYVMLSYPNLIQGHLFCYVFHKQLNIKCFCYINKYKIRSIIDLYEPMQYELKYAEYSATFCFAIYYYTI